MHEKYPRHSLILFVGKENACQQGHAYPRKAQLNTAKKYLSIVTRAKQRAGYPIAGIKQYLGHRSELFGPRAGGV